MGRGGGGGGGVGAGVRRWWVGEGRPPRSGAGMWGFSVCGGAGGTGLSRVADAAACPWDRSPGGLAPWRLGLAAGGHRGAGGGGQNFPQASSWRGGMVGRGGAVWGLSVGDCGSLMGKWHANESRARGLRRRLGAAAGQARSTGRGVAARAGGSAQNAAGSGRNGLIGVCSPRLGPVWVSLVPRTVDPPDFIRLNRWDSSVAEPARGAGWRVRI